MPHSPLPERVVHRLKRVAKRLPLERMRNVDYRKDREEAHPESISKPGGRVRELRVKPETSMIPIVIKQVHGRYTAPKLIEWLHEKVNRYNKKFKNKSDSVKNIKYELRIPNAYAISAQRIAMAKTNAPTAYEVIHESSARGKKLVEEWEKQGIDARRMKWRLQYVAQDIELNVGITAENLFLIETNTHGNEFLLVPAVDEF